MMTTTVSSLATSSTMPASQVPNWKMARLYSTSATPSEITAPARNSFPTMCSDTFLGELSSKKSISVDNGTANAPRNIMPGMQLLLPVSVQIMVNAVYAITRAASSRKNSQGFGQPVSTTSIGGVVLRVPVRM